MKKRLTEFLAYLGIGQNKFEERVGLSRGFVNTLNDNMTVKNVAKIRAAYPELNIDYLCFGEGEMLKPGTIIQHDNKNSAVIGVMHGGTVNHGGTGNRNLYNGMGKEELIAMMEDRFAYLKQKENEILQKDNRIDQIWEENRTLTKTVMQQVEEQNKYNAAYQRQMERINQLSDDLRDRERTIADLRERLAKYDN